MAVPLSQSVPSLLPVASFLFILQVSKGLVPRHTWTASYKGRAFSQKSWSENLNPLSVSEDTPRGVRCVRLRKKTFTAAGTGSWATYHIPLWERANMSLAAYAGQLEECQSALTDRSPEEVVWDPLSPESLQ